MNWESPFYNMSKKLTSSPKLTFVIAKKYELVKRLGSGSFGQVFLAKNLDNNSNVAVKLESKKCKYPQLKKEGMILKTLEHYKTTTEGIIPIYYFGEEGDFNILVMDLLGPSIEDLFNYCHRVFSLKTVLMIFFQTVCFTSSIINVQMTNLACSC